MICVAAVKSTDCGSCTHPTLTPHPQDTSSEKYFYFLSMKTEAFYKLFLLSKYLELKALSTLKISLKSEKFFVRCGRHSVDIPYMEKS